MPHFFNAVDTLVDQIIENALMCAALREIQTPGGGRVLVRNDWRRDNGKVAVLSGGGSGHEPAHAGYIGVGALSGAVLGELFASPSVSAIEHAIDALHTDAGCLLVVKNYTGDRLNFGLAAERARAKGRHIEIVLVGDDVALPGVTQPRGLAGTLLIHKIAGYYSEQGATLTEVAQIARTAAGQLRTIGLALGAAQVPGKTAEASEPALGLGIHNEPGARKVAVASARDAVTQVLEALLPRDSTARPKQWIVALNDLGGCSPQEQALLCRETLTQLGIDRVAGLIGPGVLMSALDMHGFSITLLPFEENYLRALAAPTTAIAWPGVTKVHAPERLAQANHQTTDDAGETLHDEGLEKAIREVAQVLVKSQQELDALDAASGDGDAGSTFAAGGQGLIKALDQGILPSADAARLCDKLAEVLEYSMGGSSGILLSLLFTAAETALGQGNNWPQALSAGIGKMQQYGGAALGDRTMLDALIPAVEALLKGESLPAASSAARQGAAGTAHIQAKAGRAAQVPQEAQLGHVDPGAEAIARIFETLTKSFSH